MKINGCHSYLHIVPARGEVRRKIEVKSWLRFFLNF